MVLTKSKMVELGTKMPNFNLLNPSDKNHYNSKDFFTTKTKGLVVVFMCNHCPYVIYLKDEIKEIANKFSRENISFVGINSNDTENYPADASEKMPAENYPFPYLFDGNQEVAKSFGATCTPDFFVFNKDEKLVYRGQFDNSRPGNNEEISGKDLSRALDSLVKNEEIDGKQLPSMGCNIKWKK